MIDKARVRRSLAEAGLGIFDIYVNNTTQRHKPILRGNIEFVESTISYDIPLSKSKVNVRGQRKSNLPK